MAIFSNHRLLFTTTFLLFTALSTLVAILPAIHNQNNNAPLPGSEPLSADELAGKRVFISNGCVGCHSQQVRNVEMDKVWGARPNVAADYAGNTRMSWWMNTATLMGTERTGPDLTDIGNRLPSDDWHLLHLYNPRAVVEASIMPGYRWMFEWKNELNDNDRIVNVPAEFTGGRMGNLVATKEALQLVAYLKSLKQLPLPDGRPHPEFLFKPKARENKTTDAAPAAAIEVDGGLLYASNCQACHLASGEGVKGAFPALRASPVVLNDDPTIMIDIIMNGYNAREEFAEMPAVGVNNHLTPTDIMAIVNHERSSWGNNARNIPLSEVEKIITYLNTQKTNQ